MQFFRRLSNSVSILCVFVVIFALTWIGSYIGLNNPLVNLNENQICYLFSTSAQVLAAIYGLTLTAFVFYMGTLNNEASSDETLVQSLEFLRYRYYWHLIIITFLVITSLFLTNAIISLESSKYENTSIVLINLGQAVHGVTLILIAMFICDVIYPHRVEEASKSIQDAIDPSLKNNNEQGSLEQFVQNYNEIQRLLEWAYRSHFESNLNRRRSRVSNIKLAEFLYNSHRITEKVYNRLISLISLRNAIIHGAEPKVSLNIVEESESIKKILINSFDNSGTELDTSGKYK